MNNVLRIGPSGNSEAFYAAGYKHTYEAAAWLHTLGLNAFEYSFGRGVSIGDASAQKIQEEFCAYGIEISAHAPYYTNFANESDEMIEKSVGYILRSIAAVHKMGGQRVVFHPASCGKSERGEAVARAERNIARMAETAHAAFDAKNVPFILCPETMGKLQQIGRVEEVIAFCKLDPALYPCYDFGHINAYSQGSLRTIDDFRRIVDTTADALGDEKTRNMHIHFSKIQYGASGEIRHLTFADTVYGPEYEPLGKLIEEYKLTPFIVSESDGTQSDDASFMKNFHKNDCAL